MASERRLKFGVLAIGTLVILAFVGEASYDSWRLYQQIMTANTRELGNLSRSLAAQADRTLQSGDELLVDTVDWAQRLAPSATGDDIDDALDKRRGSARQITSLALYDSSGHLVHLSGRDAAALPDISELPYFSTQREASGVGVSIHAPVDNGSVGALSLVLSRRISSADGRFAGVVVATLSLEQLRDAYQAIDLGASSTLLLTMADGTLVIRQPTYGNRSGRIRMPELVAMRAGAPITRMISIWDGRPKLIAATGVASWPLILAVQRDEADALKPWVDESRTTAVRTLLLALATALTMAGVLRQLKRSEVAAVALRTSESRYAMAMEAANEGHAEWNINEGSLFLSAKWRALHGIDLSKPVPGPNDLRHAITLHHDDLAAVQTAIEDHLANLTSAIETDYRVWRDADWRWIHARGRCQRDSDGNPASLFCSAIDVSDRRREESEKAALEKRLQENQRLEALGTLAGGIAHDFNNILGAILGFGEMAQQRATVGSPLRKDIDRVLQSGSRARLLVRRILDFSRSGMTERVLVNVQAIVEEVVAMLAPTLPAGVTVTSRLDSGSAAILGDATQLHQVAMNLATNAVQAIDEQGRVELALARETIAVGRPVLQGELSPGEYVRLTVADSGPGIDPQILARVFEPFFTTKKGSEGTGLGLSVVHGIVASLNGAIDIARGAVSGTLVTVWLPVSGEVDLPVSAEAALLPEGQGQVVMVVDDDISLLQLAEERLAELGYEPIGYASAEAALAAFQSAPDRFDAVLTDHLLPAMTGAELAHRLLAIRPGIPVALMSGNLTATTEFEMRRIGVRAVLHKPLASRELAERLADMLRSEDRQKSS